MRGDAFGSDEGEEVLGMLSDNPAFDGELDFVAPGLDGGVVLGDSLVASVGITTGKGVTDEGSGVGAAGVEVAGVGVGSVAGAGTGAVAVAAVGAEDGVGVVGGVGVAFLIREVPHSMQNFLF